MSAIEEEFSSAVPEHPQEIRADYELRVGRYINMKASARITPAGVLCAGLAVAAITFAAGYVVASARRRY